jgi:hypothetical protein
MILEVEQSKAANLSGKSPPMSAAWIGGTNNAGSTETVGDGVGFGVGEALAETDGETEGTGDAVPVADVEAEGVGEAGGCGEP